MKSMTLIGALVGVLAVSMSAHSAELTPYEARYEVQRGGSQYGEGTRKLTQQEGLFKLYSETEISLLFLSDRRRFWSEFVVDDGQVKSQVFTYKRNGTGRDSGFSGTFDGATQQLIDNDSSQVLAVDTATYRMDEAASIEQLRFDIQDADKQQFSYFVVDEKGKTDELKFKRGALETLSLPYGEVEAIKVERVRENSRRETDYWFAPELNYVLVKMAQRKEGDEVATLLLSQIN